MANTSGRPHINQRDKAVVRPHYASSKRNKPFRFNAPDNLVAFVLIGLAPKSDGDWRKEVDEAARCLFLFSIANPRGSFEFDGKKCAASFNVDYQGNNRLLSISSPEKNKEGEEKKRFSRALLLSLFIFFLRSRCVCIWGSTGGVVYRCSLLYSSLYIKDLIG